MPLIVCCYGFPQRVADPAAWEWFFAKLVRRVESALSTDVVFDWSAPYFPPSQVMDFADERWPDDFQPFNFVVDLPQLPFGHHVATWDFIFDSCGIAERDGLPRIIRDDNRYLQETLWLATHTTPSLVFSWNELFEGSHLLPDDTYDWRRFDLARAMIDSVAAGRADDLPSAAIIVDAMDGGGADGNVLLDKQGHLRRYFLRRYVPQATVLSSAMTTHEALASFEIVLSLTTDCRMHAVLESLLPDIRIVCWNAGDPTTPMAPRFIGVVAAGLASNQLRVLDADGNATHEELRVEGDVKLAAAAPDTLVHALLDDGTATFPLIVQADNDFWINTYTSSGVALEGVFERVYGRELEPASRSPTSGAFNGWRSSQTGGWCRTGSRIRRCSSMSRCPFPTSYQCRLSGSSRPHGSQCHE